MWVWMLFACSGEAPQPQSPPVMPAVELRSDAPNLVLVTLDTTRADAMGAYGAARGSSPVFDQWAARGVRFEWALSHAPTTLSSHASMFTGLDPHGHRVVRNGFPLLDGFQTLAETLQSAGYDTLGIVAASPIDAKMGMAQGFRLFDDDTLTDMGPRTEDRGDRVTRRALDLLERRDRGRPLFLWVHYYDAHSPYDAPAEFISRFVAPGTEPGFAGRAATRRLSDLIRDGSVSQADIDYLRALYQGEVAWVDFQVGRLLGELETMGILEESLVVFAGDHGEMFAETRPHPLGHGYDVDLWVSRVPLVIAGTGSLSMSPAVVTQPVKLSDLPSTVLGLLGVSEEGLGEGQDLRGLMRGETLEAAPIFLEATKSKTEPTAPGWNNLRKERGVVWRDHIFLTTPGRRRSEGLHRLDADQSPVDDLPLVEELRGLLETWDESAPPFRPETMDRETREALRALGYIE